MKLYSDITLVYTRQQCCVHSDVELVTCDLYRQLKDCSTWKEPGLVRYFFFSASEMSTDKHAVTTLDIAFGCCTAGSHLISGLVRKISIDMGHRTLHRTPACEFYLLVILCKYIIKKSFVDVLL